MALTPWWADWSVLTTSQRSDVGIIILDVPITDSSITCHCRDGGRTTCSFINDLHDIVNSNVYLFAYDTKVMRKVTTNEDAKTLQRDLDDLCSMSTQNLNLKITCQRRSTKPMPSLGFFIAVSAIWTEKCSKSYTQHSWGRTWSMRKLFGILISLNKKRSSRTSK